MVKGVASQVEGDRKLQGSGSIEIRAKSEEVPRKGHVPGPEPKAKPHGLRYDY